MQCPVCKKHVTVGSAHDRYEAWRRALAKHLETDAHPLGILADYAARYIIGDRTVVADGTRGMERGR